MAGHALTVDIDAGSDESLLAAIGATFAGPGYSTDDNELAFMTDHRTAYASDATASPWSARRVRRTVHLWAAGAPEEVAVFAIQVIASMPGPQVRGYVADDSAALVDSMLRTILDEPGGDRTSEQRQRGLEAMALCFVRPRMGGGPFTPEEYAMAAHNRREAEVRQALRDGLIPGLNPT